MIVQGGDRPASAWCRRAQAPAFVAALAALFVFTVLFRFLALVRGFSNDHFLHLAGAQQMLLGEWPTRDFVDQGLPLMYVVSAAAQLLLGRTLLAEGLLVACAFALAAVFTALAVRELTGSRVLALCAALLEVAVVPRTYGYPKMLVYAAGFYLLQRYVTQPTLRRLWLLAAAVVIAFLFRHDHGVYLGAAGILATWLVASEGSARLRRALTFAGMIALLALPYLVYVQINGGWWAYLQTGLEFRAGELGRQEYIWPGILGAQPFLDALLYEYWALPLLALLVLVAWRARTEAASNAARVIPIIAVAVVLNATFLRSPLPVRLPDVIVPAVLLGAWLAAAAWQARPMWLWRPAAMTLGLVFTCSVAAAGQIVDQLDRAGLLRSWTRLADGVDEVGWTLLDRHSPRQMPSRAAAALHPFYDYAIRCTDPAHRLLVAGFVPEVHIFAQRPFAGGMAVYVSGYYNSEPRQRHIVATMRRQVVPFVLIPGAAYATNFDDGWPIIAGYVRSRYEPMVMLGDDPTVGVQVLRDRTMPVAGHDEETGWPCLVPGSEARRTG
jgi:hypothetical protein